MDSGLLSWITHKRWPSGSQDLFCGCVWPPLESLVTKNCDLSQFDAGYRQIKLLIVVISLEMRHGIVQWAGEARPDSACSPAAHVLGFAKHADYCCFHLTPQLGQQRSIVQSCGVSRLSIRLAQHLCHQLACAKLAVAVIDSRCLAGLQVWSCFFLCWRESYALV